MTIADQWLARFESALRARDRSVLQDLFTADSHWRDVLALTWRIQTVSGAESIATQIQSHARPTNLRTDPERTPPRQVTRAGTKCLEILFRFETSIGEGNGVLRLVGDEPKAWTFLTVLHELKGHEEHIGRLRPPGSAYSRDFSGPNWLDLR